MKILVIDTVSKTASCALCEDGTVTAFCERDTNLDHSRIILPQTMGMLESAGTSLSEIDAFCAVCGPGSFTGIRIGISAVKGFAWAGDKPCISVSSTEAAAYSADSGSVICSVIYARADELYCGFFGRSGAKITRLCNDFAASAGDILQRAEQLGADILCGDGEELSKYGCTLPRGGTHSAKAAAMAAYAGYTRGELLSCHEIEPIYLRQTQAERMRGIKESL